MSESKIHSAMVSAYLASAVMPQARTAFEGRSFEPVQGQSWARLTNMPSRRDKFGIRATDSSEAAGILQIDLFFPRNTGHAPILDAADKLIEHFDPHTVIEYEGQRVKIRRAQRSQIRSEPVWLSVSIDIYYWANIQ